MCVVELLLHTRRTRSCMGSKGSVQIVNVGLNEQGSTGSHDLRPETQNGTPRGLRVCVSCGLCGLELYRGWCGRSFACKYHRGLKR